MKRIGELLLEVVTGPAAHGGAKPVAEVTIGADEFREIVTAVYGHLPSAPRLRGPFNER